MTATRPDGASRADRASAASRASLWVVDTRKLGRRAGAMQPVQLTIPAGTPIGLDVIGVPETGEVELDVRLESVTEGIWVSGTASAQAVGVCSRCLVEVTQPVAAQLRDLFVYPGSTTDWTTDDDELPRVSDDQIDLEPLVRDELVLALPLVPLCKPDCAGLCPECGERLEELEPGHSHETMDARWAGLRDRFGAAEEN